MGDRDLFDAMRKKARSLVLSAYQNLDASKTADGKMAPHVARERILKLRTLARQMNALCDWLEAIT